MTRTRKRPALAATPRLSLDEWFIRSGWEPFPFQREAWAAYRAGECGLIHASTGTGKTYAAFLGPVLEALGEPPSDSPPPLRLLWITPLRALSGDTALSLEAPLGPLGLNWDVGTRTGDSSSAVRARQKKRLPTVLVTTPESLSLFLTHADAREKFAGLRCVIVDEWHELLGSKRGVLTELALARLRTLRPGLNVWGLSATLGNLDEALASLVGVGNVGRIIRGRIPKSIAIHSAIPTRMERFPWAGHLGLSLLPQVVEVIDAGRTALVFTNTRSQTEIWYRAILAARPDWAGIMALHHGSLDRSARDWVEDQLRAGTVRCVVCTSSLDLGVDFAPVDRVVQIGSPKGVARLLQRAGRAARSRLNIELVRGNHDRAGDPPIEWADGWQTLVLVDPPFCFQHHPRTSIDGYVLAGHLHPGIDLAGRGNERFRLPCFWFSAGAGVLPAFGGMTGTAAITPAPGDGIFAIADGEIIPIPTPQPKPAA